jgi:GMP synthase-like glutamine amidotransferase
MKPVIVVRHEDPDNLALGEEVLRAAGLRLEYVDLWRGGSLPAAGDVEAVVLLGGTMGVGDREQFPFLAAERDLVQDCLRQDVPVLGICLGAQLLADAAGGRVMRAPRRSIGFLPVARTDLAASDQLFNGWCATDRVLRWHEDTFTLPPGAVLLMVADDVRNQAFRVGRSAWGVQFHIELDGPLLEAWIESSGSSLGEWDTNRQELLDGAAAWLPHQQAHARQTFSAFAAVVRGRIEVAEEAG